MLPGRTSPISRAAIRMNDQSLIVMLPSNELTGSPLAAVGDDSLPLVSERLELT